MIYGVSYIGSVGSRRRVIKTPDGFWKIFSGEIFAGESRVNRSASMQIFERRSVAGIKIKYRAAQTLDTAGFQNRM